VILVGEQEHCLHPPDGWGWSAELEKTSARVDRINDEHAAEARWLSLLVMGIPTP
jgi:hypothetical protein